MKRMGRKPKLTAIAEVLICSLVVLAALPQPAYAYVDPSVMTYTIQAVAGAAVALGAVLGVALRRTRRFLFRLFKIDENANKIVEPDVVAVSKHGSASEGLRREADDEAIKMRETLAHGKPAKRLSWPKRFIRALIGCAFLVWTVAVFAPVDLVAAGTGSLLFTLSDVLNLLLVMGVAITVLLALLISFFPGRAFDVILTIVVACGICCYVQALFLNESLPVADGRPLDLMGHKRMVAISTVVWAAILVVFLIFNAKKKPACRAFVLVISILLFSVQGVSMISIVNDTLAQESAAGEEQETIMMSTYGINEVGSEANVTVFVLDTFDTDIMDMILEDDPHALDEFTGFTYFHNSTGSLIPTRYGVPFLLTNYMPQPGQTFDQYIQERYQTSPFLADIVDNGFEATVYSDSFNMSEVEPYVENVYYGERRTFDNKTLWLSLEKMAMYRDMPWILKPPFWFYTDELNSNSEDETYFIDDPAYFEKLKTEKLSVSAEADKTFRFIHLLGAHYPFFMDENGNRVSENDSDQLRQSEGTLKIVAEYLRQLKELGLYDQSTIIVTADHGYWYLTEELINEPTSPIMLVKPAEDAQQASEPLKISNVPTGHLDYAATVIAAVGGDSSAYGPTVFEVEDGPRDRYYWETTSDGHSDQEWLQFVIQGDVMDWNSWHSTGEKIEINR